MHIRVLRQRKTNSFPPSQLRVLNVLRKNISRITLLRHERIPLTAAGYPEYVLRKLRQQREYNFTYLNSLYMKLDTAGRKFDTTFMQRKSINNEQPLTYKHCISSPCMVCEAQFHNLTYPFCLHQDYTRPTHHLYRLYLFLNTPQL